MHVGTSGRPSPTVGFGVLDEPLFLILLQPHTTNSRGISISPLKNPLKRVRNGVGEDVKGDYKLWEQQKHSGGIRTVTFTMDT